MKKYNNNKQKSPLGYKITTAILTVIIVLMTAFMAVTLPTNWFGKGVPEGWGGGNTPSTPTPDPDPDGGEDDDVTFEDSMGYEVENSGIDLKGSTAVTGTNTTVDKVDNLVSTLQNAKAGDTIILKEGTYKLSQRVQLINSGEYNGYITVKAEDGKKVVIDFSEMEFDDQNRGIQIEGDYWYWYGIEIMGAGDNGMFIGGNYNIVENCVFHHNRDTGLQLGRSISDFTSITQWPSYNYIKNCTSYNNYDNETGGENADGFAAKLTVGYGNVFDGCISYRNSDDGWDLYAYNSNGDIGAVILYNCVAFENGFLYETVAEFNDKVNTRSSAAEDTTRYTYDTSSGDGNGFKLGGSSMRGNVKMYNCVAFNNKLNGVTDNSNPGVLTIENVTSYNNGATVDHETGLVNGGATGDAQANNIDTARTEASYNNYKNVLSVADSYGNPGNDRYRGSATNSIFFAGSGKADQIEAYEDVYSEESGRAGTSITAPDSATVFEQLPFTSAVGADGTVTVTPNITGKGNTTAHTDYRNDDLSINMGDILAIKDADAVSGTGASLNKTGWDEYEHFYETEIDKAATEEDSVLLAVYNTLYLYTDTAAVYQDFTLTTRMMDATISWTSSNEDILHINKQYNSSNSGSQDVDLVVYRAAEDEKVTLTATIVYNGKAAVKRFDLTVKADAPAIGDIYADGLEGASDTTRRFIIDQYEVFEEPELIVENAADYNGKTLSEGSYNVETIYEYAPADGMARSRVGNFSPSVAGVYTITKNISLVGTPADVHTYSYTIYVASNTASVDFTTDEQGESTGSLNVFRDGYIISGDVTNVKGSINSYSTSDAAEIAQLGAMTNEQKLAALQAKEGVASHSFEDNTISAKFENENTEAYTVYYWFTNGLGDVTSQVYDVAVDVVEISTPEQFNTELKNNASNVIYLLTADLDFSQTAFEPVGNLYGLINGNYHTISNVTVSGSSRVGLFEYLDGGTIMNIRFNEIDISATGSRAGLIGQSRGGYISEVYITNINVENTSERTAALIGNHTEGDLSITYVSVENDSEHVIHSGTQYTGGIIAKVQAGSVGETYGIIEIKDVFVNSSITSTNNYAGGIIGDLQDRSADDKITLERCFVLGTVSAQQYLAGIVGAHRPEVDSVNILNITECIFFGTLVDKDGRLTESIKNGSGIVGRYSEAAIVNIVNCQSRITEYYYTEFVSQITEQGIGDNRFWTTTYVRTYDMENVWEYVGNKAPYARLRFTQKFESASSPEAPEQGGESAGTEA